MINAADIRSIKLNGADIVQTSISKIEDGTRKNYFSLFPSESLIQESIPDSFVINNPMNTVGGDGYWFEEDGDMTLLAVFDCMGHGHLASMMTRIYVNTLKDIIAEHGIIFPHEILTLLHEEIRKKFQNKEKTLLGTGADFGIVRINRHLNELEFAGAKMNLYEVKKGALNIIKADRMQIGEFFDHPHEYKTVIVDLNETKASNFYLFSDGLKDLMGGPDNKKLGSGRLNELLESNFGRPMAEQKEKITRYLANWKGSNSALDDVLLIGFQA